MNPSDKSHGIPLPFAKLLGIDIVQADKHCVRGRLLVRDDLCTAGDTVHGGALMALADTLGATGAWLNLPSGKGTATLESNTNFLGRAQAGATVEGEAIPVHIGKRTSVWQTRICGEDGRLIALVTQTQMILG